MTSSVLVMVPNGPEVVEVTCTVGWEVLVLCGCWNVGIVRMSAECIVLVLCGCWNVGIVRMSAECIVLVLCGCWNVGIDRMSAESQG
jgi:hypothetical protein